MSSRAKASAFVYSEGDPPYCVECTNCDVSKARKVVTLHYNKVEDESTGLVAWTDIPWTDRTQATYVVTGSGPKREHRYAQGFH